MECGFGYIIIRSPYTPHSIYLRGTIGFERALRLRAEVLEVEVGSVEFTL